MARGLVAARQCDERVRALELILFRRCSTVYQRISQKMSVSATVIWDNTREIGNSAARYPLRFCPVCSRISFITRRVNVCKKKERKKRRGNKKRKKIHTFPSTATTREGKNVVSRGNIEAGCFDGWQSMMMICDAFESGCNCPTVFRTMTGSIFIYLFIYFSVINGLGYDIYLTRGSYLFVTTSSCSNDGTMERSYIFQTRDKF